MGGRLSSPSRDIEERFLGSAQTKNKTSKREHSGDLELI